MVLVTHNEMATDASSDKPRVFVSYSRKDSTVADALASALKEREFDVTIDRRSLEYGEEWQPRLATLIREADAIVCLVSPNSVRSVWCTWEMSEAAKYNKRLVPVRIESVEAEDIQAEIQKIHFLPVDGSFILEKHLTSLVEALTIDRSWMRIHTRLTQRAWLWDEAGRPKIDRLLGGAELAEAEDWLNQALGPQSRWSPYQQPPTELQRAFITASRSAEETANLEKVMRERATRIEKGHAFSTRAQLAINAQCFDRALRLALAGIWLSEQDTPEILFEDVVDAARDCRLLLEVRPESGLGAAALTPNLGLAAVLSRNGDLAVWNVESARVVSNSLRGGRSAVQPMSVALDPDGKHALVARFGGHAEVIDAVSGEILHTLRPQAGQITSVDLVDGTAIGFSVIEQRAANTGGTSSSALHTWNIQTGEHLYAMRDFSGAIDTVLIHPDRSVLVTNHWSNECLAWSLESGKRIRSLSADDGILAIWCFSPDGKRSLVPDDDTKVLVVHEWPSQARISRLVGHQNTIRCACWSPDGTKIASGDADGIVWLWDAHSGGKNYWLGYDASPSAPDKISALSFTHDGKGLIVAEEYSATMTIWNLQDRRIATRVHGHESSTKRIRVSNDGRRFCSVAPGEAVRVWTLEDFPHVSVPTVSLPTPSLAGLRRRRREEAPEMPSIDWPSRAPGERVFGRLRKRTALDAVLKRGLGDAEIFSPNERKVDRQLQNAPVNPFQALRDRNRQV